MNQQRVFICLLFIFAAGYGCVTQPFHTKTQKPSQSANTNGTPEHKIPSMDITERSIKLTPSLTPSLTPDASITETILPEKPNHFLGIIPGKTTMEEVSFILGKPDSTCQHWLSGEPDPETGEFVDLPCWTYISIDADGYILCGQQCEPLYVHINFTDDGVAFLVELLFFNNEPTLGEITSKLGEPELSAGSPFIYPWGKEREILEERGIEWWNMAKVWFFVYPDSGVYALFDERYVYDEEAGIELPVYIPLDSKPPADWPVYSVNLFEPTTLEDFCHSLLTGILNPFCP
jgi:hypothetical protein